MRIGDFIETQHPVDGNHIVSMLRCVRSKELLKNAVVKPYNIVVYFLQKLMLHET